MQDPQPIFTPTDFLAVTNQILDTAYPAVIIEGEVANFKTNQGKFVFFSLKDAESSVDCFMMLFQLRHPLEDGMKIRIRATPKLTKWGKFSLTVTEIIPVGQGSIKKSLDLLRAKLDKEGLFDPAKKRPVSNTLSHIAIISSTDAAGYKDFLKIADNRWGGLHIEVAHTGVQGLGAADQIIRALGYLNEHSSAEVIAIIRGGGSADDLAVFNDEALVRAIASSKIPVITGIGHEVDTTLADLAADLRASTPSSAAERLTRDKKAIIAEFKPALAKVATSIKNQIDTQKTTLHTTFVDLHRHFLTTIKSTQDQVAASRALLTELSPEATLARGYALLSGDPTSPGNIVKITTAKYNIKAEVQNVTKRK